jgi:ABC-type multidrug transport system ATPase subunit
MWAFISRIAQTRAVVLTTHSMEEADALCSKIGIMIHGNLRAQGSSQAYVLKSPLYGDVTW